MSQYAGSRDELVTALISAARDERSADQVMLIVHGDLDDRHSAADAQRLGHMAVRVTPSLAPQRRRSANEIHTPPLPSLEPTTSPLERCDRER